MPDPSAEPVSLAQARELSGLRLALIRGLPSPWSQAARGLFHVKGIPVTLAWPAPSDPPGLLLEWTRQESYPVAALDDERPRTGWAEIVLLAERLAPTPALLPTDAADRALCFGLLHEIAGEMGLGWCRRLESTDAGMKQDPPSPMATYLGSRYGYRPDSAAAAASRVRDVLALLGDRLRSQREGGRRFLVGDELSAVDIYWATFCNLVSPLPPDLLPMPPPLRPMFTSSDPEVRKILDDGLLEHRDFVYEQYLELPVPL